MLTFLRLLQSLRMFILALFALVTSQALIVKASSPAANGSNELTCPQCIPTIADQCSMEKFPNGRPFYKVQRATAWTDAKQGNQLGDLANAHWRVYASKEDGMSFETNGPSTLVTFKVFFGPKWEKYIYTVDTEAAVKQGKKRGCTHGMPGKYTPADIQKVVLNWEQNGQPNMHD